MELADTQVLEQVMKNSKAFIDARFTQDDLKDSNLRKTWGNIKEGRGTTLLGFKTLLLRTDLWKNNTQANYVELIQWVANYIHLQDVLKKRDPSKFTASAGLTGSGRA